jgi:hypothetical protein
MGAGGPSVSDVMSGRGHGAAAPRLGFSLPESKFHPPEARTGIVARTALVERLTAAQAPVITVTAPPGYGKTTLLAQWTERIGSRSVAVLRRRRQRSRCAAECSCGCAGPDRARRPGDILGARLLGCRHHRRPPVRVRDRIGAAAQARRPLPAPDRRGPAARQSSPPPDTPPGIPTTTDKPWANTFITTP